MFFPKLDVELMKRFLKEPAALDSYKSLFSGKLLCFSPSGFLQERPQFWANHTYKTMCEVRRIVKKLKKYGD